jgi:hypothetical protein
MRPSGRYECNLSPNVNPPGSIPPAAGIAGGIYLPGATLHQRGNGSTLCATRPIVAKKISVEETSTLAGTGLTTGSVSAWAVILER